MKYLLYKITNKINGKFYIGAHKTKDENDDYMGSGKYLKNSQKRHGIENFEKVILESFEDSKTMFKRESEIIDEDFILREDTYNIKLGGDGGFDFINENGLNKISKGKDKGGLKGGKVHRERMKTDPEYRKKKIERLKKAHREGKFTYGLTFKGKSHTEESKKKIGIANSIKQTGEGNSQYGTMWIHSLKEKRSKKIKKEEFTTWEAKGWLKGRKMKFM